MPTLVFRVNTAGAGGAATGETQLAFPLDTGFVSGVRLAFHASAPATTTVVIAEVEGLQQTILAPAAGNVGGLYYPSTPVHTTQGVAVDGQSSVIQVEGPIKVTVAGCNALQDAVIVTLRLLRNREVN